MAAKYNIPVCLRAGGVGFSEHVQHVSMIDLLVISGFIDNCVTEIYGSPSRIFSVFLYC